MISVKRSVGHSAYRSLTSGPIPLVVRYCFWRDSPQWARPSSFMRFLDHTQPRNTAGRTPLDDWSARRRDLYLTTHTIHNTQISMSPLEFEPTISAGERPQTYALDRAATGTGSCKVWSVFNDYCFMMVLICKALFSVLITLLWYSKIRRRFKLCCINSSRMMNAVSQKLIWKTCTQNRTDRSWWFVEISCTTAWTISENRIVCPSMDSISQSRRSDGLMRFSSLVILSFIWF